MHTFQPAPAHFSGVPESKKSFEIIASWQPLSWHCGCQDRKRVKAGASIQQNGLFANKSEGKAGERIVYAPSSMTEPKCAASTS